MRGVRRVGSLPQEVRRGEGARAMKRQRFLKPGSRLLASSADDMRARRLFELRSAHYTDHGFAVRVTQLTRWL
jgi:HJR/Mrr/RecB family endonuclease